MDFVGFLSYHSSYVVLYTQCLRYDICSAWFLDIRISTCFNPSGDVWAIQGKLNKWSSHIAFVTGFEKTWLPRTITNI